MNITGFYYLENNEKMQIDEGMVARIKRQLTLGEPVDTGGKTLYPIYAPVPDDAYHSKVEAWSISHGGHPQTLWYWRIREHKRQHYACKEVEDGLCAFRMLEYLVWNRGSKQWELGPIVNKATPEQEKVLNSN